MGAASGGEWLLYGLGGGLGHFQRSLSLGRAAARRGINVSLVVNTPWAPLRSPWFEPQRDGSTDSSAPGAIHVHRLPPQADRDAIAGMLEPLLQREWSAIVVDTFPRGLGGELAPWLPRLSGLKVWTHRDLCPEYLEQFQIRRDWAPKYDLCLSPGDDGDLTDICHSTPPWLIASPAELTSAAAARDSWGANRDQPLVVVVGAGRREEQDEWIRVSRQLASMRNDLQVRTATLDSSSVWPLFPRLAGADIVLGSGGYNIVRETQALNVPLLAQAQRRMYDRQQRRIQLAPHARMLPPSPSPATTLAMIDEALAQRDRSATPSGPSADRFPGGFVNGAEIAVDLISAHAR